MAMIDCPRCKNTIVTLVERQIRVILPYDNITSDTAWYCMGCNLAIRSLFATSKWRIGLELEQTKMPDM